MKNTWTKLALAAIIVLAAGFLFVTVLDKSSTPAYALEQTIQANHSVRFLHILNEYEKIQTKQKDAREIWAVFDESGQLYRCRVEIQQSEDGAKSIVWHDDKAQVWLRDKKILLTILNKETAKQIVSFIKEVDPLLLVERLNTLEKEGKVKIDIQEPAETKMPIVLTAIYQPGSETPDKKLILWVNSQTKLVEKIENYKQIKSEYELQGRYYLSEYNQPTDEKTFTLDVPPDVMRIDQTTQDVGLPQGSLSQEEIAEKVVLEFLNALIARDFNKAGQLMGGIPGSVLEKPFKDQKIIRIISMSKPEPHPQTRSLRVPCVIETEKNGKRFTSSPPGPYVRQVNGQPGRWVIIGGF